MFVSDPMPSEQSYNTVSFDQHIEVVEIEQQPEPVEKPKPRTALNKTINPRMPAVQPRPVDLNRTAPTRLPPNANLFSQEEEQFPPLNQAEPVKQT
jgi:hypothetical protein